MTFRMRVALLFTAMGFALCVCFAIAVGYITEDYENIVVEEILSSQARDYAERIGSDPSIPLPQTSRLSGYLSKNGTPSRVPLDFRPLGPGIHEDVPGTSDGIHVGVFDTAIGRLYFKIDLGDIEVLENHLALILFVIIVLGTLTSAALGGILSRWAIRPVSRFAAMVSALSPQPAATQFGEGLADDELGQLGRAIDAYQARLVGAEAAELQFFADAAHELKTPVSVVKGAVELLLDDPATEGHSRPRIMRLDRGVRELADLLEALLRLARHGYGKMQTVTLRDWLLGYATRLAALHDARLNIRVDAGAEQIELPVSDAELIINAIVRSLVPAGGTGHLVVSANREAIQVAYRSSAGSVGGDDVPTGRRGDRRLGLTLVGRLAERLGWRIEEQDGHAPSFLMHFGARSIQRD